MHRTASQTHSTLAIRRTTATHALAAGLLTALVAGCSTTHESPVAEETGPVAQAYRSAPQDAARLAAPPAPPAALRMVAPSGVMPFPPPAAPPANTENYADLDDNPVHRTSTQPVSTFSVDVDTGSYSNVRRMLLDGVRPPADAVRAEEFINYFDYGHPAPADRAVPFRVSTELAPAPWNAKRQLLMIGIKGYDIPREQLPPANLVLLVDTSGSMQSADKLPLLKRAFGMLVRQLRPQDTLSIVAYAGSAGLVLPPTAGDRQGEILAALSRLQAGGSTNGGEGISLAYDLARQSFVEGGSNRVLLATDGDFNVGTVDQGALETLVADQRASGIALTTLGFGSGNYNDALAERLADLGNGNHAYIDSALEARRVLVEAMGSTLTTIRLREPGAAQRGLRQRQGRCRRDRCRPRGHRAVRDHPGRLGRGAAAGTALQRQGRAHRCGHPRGRPRPAALQAARRGRQPAAGNPGAAQPAAPGAKRRPAFCRRGRGLRRPVAGWQPHRRLGLGWRAGQRARCAEWRGAGAARGVRRTGGACAADG